MDPISGNVGSACSHATSSTKGSTINPGSLYLRYLTPKTVPRDSSGPWHPGWDCGAVGTAEESSAAAMATATQEATIGYQLPGRAEGAAFGGMTISPLAHSAPRRGTTS